MFIKRFTLFKLMGFKVRMDLSWLILGVLITWSLAMGLFPQLYPDLSRATYWWMGIAGCVVLFFSIIFHEFAHSLVARAYNMPMKGITLFIFGGVAEMEDEPASPKVEFQTAVAGPVSSLVLALGAALMFRVGNQLGWPTPVIGVIDYTTYLNVILALFNLVPAFPLDGGRILRSAIWHWKGSLIRATRIASYTGEVFGFILIGLGVVAVVAGNFITGMWWFLIGLFLRQAAVGSYQRQVLRRVLEGEPVHRFMNAAPVSVPPTASVEQLVNDYVYHYHHKMFPVVENGHLNGCVTTDRIKDIARHDWAVRTVGEISRSCTSENTIGPEDDAVEALTRMNKSGSSRLMVVKDDRLVGVISLKDLMQFFSLKMELEPSHGS